MSEKLVAVILCGGSGSRLWPLSRTQNPKQFLKLIDQNTLLQTTVKRNIEGMGIEPGHIVTVTLCSLQDETARQLNEISPALLENMLCEPEALNTAAAVAFAINYVAEKFGDDAFVWIQPADHFVGNLTALGSAIMMAEELACKGRMVIFGIEPSRPEQGYGYIQKGQAIEGTSTYNVKSFHEKPDLKTAEAFMSSGEYLWNSGMYFFRAGTGIAHLETYVPETIAHIRNAVADSKNPRIPNAAYYRKVKIEPFEKAVTEKAEGIAVVPTDPQWSDIGSWESLWEIKTKDSAGNATRGNVVCNGIRDSMILAEDRLVTCVGLSGIVVIETGDSVLVANKHDSNALKVLVNTLKDMNRLETIAAAGKQFSWGRSKNIIKRTEVIFDELIVYPESAIEEQMSGQQTQWFVASGTACFMIDGETFDGSQNNVMVVNRGSLYTITNRSNYETLKLYRLAFAEKPVLQAQERKTLKLFGGVPAQGRAAGNIA